MISRISKLIYIKNDEAIFHLALEEENKFLFILVEVLQAETIMKMGGLDAGL